MINLQIKEIPKEETWSIVRKEYDYLLERLSPRMPYYENAISDKKSYPLSALYVKEGLKYRIANLTETAIKLLEDDKTLPATIITRSIFETVSLLFFLYERIEIVSETIELKDIGKFLEKLAVGGKSIIAPKNKDGELITAYNILNAIDKLGKMYKGIRKDYDHLSEFAHPNCLGVLMSFSQYNKEDNCVEFSLDALHNKVDNPNFYALHVLCMSLLISHLFEEGIDKLLPCFKEICEKEGE